MSPNHDAMALGALAAATDAGRQPGRDIVIGGIDLMDLPVTLDLDALHRGFLEDRFEICKCLQSLCEIVHLYNSDVLLVSGRPSRLPGVQSLLRLAAAVPERAGAARHDGLRVILGQHVEPGRLDCGSKARPVDTQRNSSMALSSGWPSMNCIA